ncbi:MAG TPA: cyclic nucleotide-binding domain-containing protein [Acidimicrobiales bacterium]|nr:cyclic nucleotide-binding domain-containing protein [Acidimicrobiales bacterium]
MTTIDRVVALQRVPLFADVPGRTLASVAVRATEVEVRVGQVVIEQGAVEDHLFALVRGRLVATDGERVLRELEVGATVGELAALAPEPRSATVTALAPSLLLRIDRPVLDELLADHPELARGVITSLVRMIRSSTPS